MCQKWLILLDSKAFASFYLSDWHRQFRREIRNRLIWKTSFEFYRTWRRPFYLQQKCKKVVFMISVFFYFFGCLCFCSRHPAFVLHWGRVSRMTKIMTSKYFKSEWLRKMLRKMLCNIYGDMYFGKKKLFVNVNDEVHISILMIILN